jgi:glycosyltransferase involved in cell wall biosynthesis
VISAQNPFETGIVAWLLSRKGIPFDLQLHTDPFSPFFKKGHGVMNRLRVFMARFLLPKARRVRVVSERIRRHLVALIPDPPPITVLPIFVDVSHIESAELSYDLHKLYPRFKTIIMTLSRLEPEKNIGLAITAFARLHDRFPGVGLVIIGKGSERSRLEQAAKEQGVASQVVFHGWVDDTASAFKTTDIFLLTSDFEGFALTLVEAAAAGLPIVTTDVGLVGDILKDEKGALVCPPCDPGCMAMKLEHLLLNVPLGRQLALNARRSVRDSLIRTNEEYIEAYRRLWSD